MSLSLSTTAGLSFFFFNNVDLKLVLLLRKKLLLLVWLTFILDGLLSSLYDSPGEIADGIAAAGHGQSL